MDCANVAGKFSKIIREPRTQNGDEISNSDRVNSAVWVAMQNL